MSSTGSLIITLGVLGAVVVVSVLAWRSKRDGESFEHAYQRLLNTDEHKEREARKRAGLEEPTQKPAAPPEDETAS